MSGGSARYPEAPSPFFIHTFSLVTWCMCYNKLMTSEKRSWIFWMVFVVLVIVLIFGLWRAEERSGGLAQNQGQTPASATSPIQLVPQFPSGLIVDSNAQIVSSYATNYSASLNQYSTEWYSAMSVADIYNAYINYFQSNGWTITNRQTNYSNSRGLYAINGSTTEASISIVTRAVGGSDVTSVYVVK
jgi:hypothetical protein